jgi:hypothetical protein
MINILMPLDRDDNEECIQQKNRNVQIVREDSDLDAMTKLALYIMSINPRRARRRFDTL